MSGQEESEKAEIVIVRRRVVDDAGATKGGAWKIAYADFVTAMMAFFLVMWLINASNEETRAQVASYFNPIKLTDSSTGARSLKDMKDTRNPKSRETGETAEGSPSAKQDAKDEAELLANPPKSLDRIAKTVSEAEFRNAGLESKVEIAPSLKPDASNPGVGDPFDPESWEKAAPAPPVAEPTKPAATEPRHEEAKVEKPLDNETPADPETASSATTEARDIARDIAVRLATSPEQLRRSVEVKETPQGILVSLTESADFEMFRTGSAEPEPQALKLVDAIAAALESRPGDIIVRGHTDSRPYRKGYYDNWQLSTARAHLARYMLIRGGVDQARIRRVEGVADLEPKNAKSPQAPENRRIEIFVSPGGK